jgi:eukaryotic-like serine/threonine-protein kinase
MIDAFGPGTSLGRYELLAPIGRGGMATVWAARIAGTGEVGRWVAVKVILPSLAGDPELDKMFLDEGRLARRIRHPNVVEVFEVADHEGTPFMTMEWIEGESLHALLTATARRRTITPAMAVSLIARVAAGLHVAHGLCGDDDTLLGVVHRDVSPHNILISTEGAVKLVDFGVAKARGRLAETTSIGQLKGKFGYMSPEQATDNPIDRRSDIFSLGIVLFELTTGRRLFRGRNDAETLRQVTSAEIPWPSRIVKNYPNRLERIVLKALERDPMRRYQSAAALQLDLEAYLERAQSRIEQRHVALLLEQVLGGRIRQRRAAIEEAEQVLSETVEPVARRQAELEPVWEPLAQPTSSAAEVVPESSRTMLNSSSEIEVPARSSIGYAAVFGAGALVVVAGLAVALRVSRAETSETSVPTLGRAALSAPSLETMMPSKVRSATSAGAESCSDRADAARRPQPNKNPKAACSPAQSDAVLGPGPQIQTRQRPGHQNTNGNAAGAQKSASPPAEHRDD